VGIELWISSWGTDGVTATWVSSGEGNGVSGDDKGDADGKGDANGGSDEKP
jgi:hypothetical protein